MLDTTTAQDTDLVRRGIEAEQRERDDLERTLVSEMGDLALEHDRRYRELQEQVEQLTGLVGGVVSLSTLKERDTLEGALSELSREVFMIGADLGPAIRLRARTVVLALNAGVPLIRCGELAGAEADEFVRPLFEAAGIADRYISDDEIIESYRNAQVATT